MQLSLNFSRLLRCSLPVLCAASGACATASYDNQPESGADGGAGIVIAGGTGIGSAGSLPVAGSKGSAAGSSSSAGGSSAGGALGSAGSASKGGSSSGGSSTGGADHAGSAGSAGASSAACTAAPWVANMAYRMGDKATKSGKEYTAAWYTMADPDAHCCGNGQDWAASVPCP